MSVQVINTRQMVRQYRRRFRLSGIPEAAAEVVVREALARGLHPEEFIDDCVRAGISVEDVMNGEMP